MLDELTTVAVGIGEIYLSKDPATVLAAFGLGSCVGVSVYDPVRKIGGMAHVLLPTSKEANQQTIGLKFADTAVPTLIREFVAIGVSSRRLVCKIAGGAQMLNAPGHADGFRIGERNVQAVKAALEMFGIVPTAMDVGGCQGRTLRLVVATGEVLVKSGGRGNVRL